MNNYFHKYKTIYSCPFQHQQWCHNLQQLLSITIFKIRELHTANMLFYEAYITT